MEETISAKSGSYFISVQEVGTPFQWFINLPAWKAKEIREGNDGIAVNFARAVASEYEGTDDPNRYWRMLDGHRYLMDFKDEDRAIMEIRENFMLHGMYEPKTTEIVKDVVKPGMQTVDIGASIGYFTLLLARQVGTSGKVYTVEPTTNQFRYLTENIQKNGYADRVLAWNVAASDIDGMVHIQCNATNTKDVEGNRMDSVLPKEPVDFIKMDTDGSDLRALKGLQETIARSPNLMIVVEYYPKYLEALGADPKEFTALIEKDFTHEVIDGDYGDGCWNWLCRRR